MLATIKTVDTARRRHSVRQQRQPDRRVTLTRCIATKNTTFQTTICEINQQQTHLLLGIIVAIATPFSAKNVAQNQSITHKLRVEPTSRRQRFRDNTNQTHSQAAPPRSKVRHRNDRQARPPFRSASENKRRTKHTH